MANLNTPSAYQAPDAYELLHTDLGTTNGHGALFIHTTSASLAIDENGICRDAFNLDGSALTDVERCVGAQYIAAVDADGFAGKPTVGGHALLMQKSGAARPAVIKTAEITGVIYATDIIEPLTPLASA